MTAHTKIIAMLASIWLAMPNSGHRVLMPPSQLTTDWYRDQSFNSAMGVVIATVNVSHQRIVSAFNTIRPSACQQDFHDRQSTAISPAAVRAT